MKQLLFLILAICAVLLIGCQQENAFEDPTETDRSVLDTTWQEATQIHQTEITEKRSETVPPTQTVIQETTEVPTEGTIKTDNEGAPPTETEPKATTPPTTETKTRVEETVPPTETTEPTTKPTEDIKPQGPAATVSHETTVTTPRETVPTGPRDNPTVTEPPATTAPVTTEAPTEPETQPSEPSEPPKPTATEPTEFDIHYWITFAKDYAEKVGLALDEEAIWCWDNPITASNKSKYLVRDICGILDRYSKDPDITAVWIWSEQRSDSAWNIYIGYA